MENYKIMLGSKFAKDQGQINDFQNMLHQAQAYLAHKPFVFLHKYLLE